MRQKRTTLKRGRRKRISVILRSLESRFSVRKSFKLGELIQEGREWEEPIQRWFCYREGYSLALAARLLRDVSPAGLVIDPCCGTGATLMAARDLGCSFIGIDTNPLAAFASRVKTTQYSDEERHRFRDLRDTLSGLRPTDPVHPPPALRRIERVFMPEILHALLIIQHGFIEMDDGKTKDFFLLAWLSVLEGLSNLRREGGLKQRRRRRLCEGGYEVLSLEDWQSVVFPADTFGHVLSAFLSRVQEMLSDLEARLTNGEDCRSIGTSDPVVLRGDAMALEEFVTPESADAVVFSPPYLNTLNYVNAYRIELWMGGFLKGYQDRRDLNRGSIRSHLDTQLTRPGDGGLPEGLEDLIGLMDADALWNQDIPQMVRGYFHDLATVLEKVFLALKPGGVCRIVVGTSAYGRVVIPTDLLLAVIAQAKGFTVERISVARSLGTSPQQMSSLKSFREYMRESILFLRKG